MHNSTENSALQKEVEKVKLDKVVAETELENNKKSFAEELKKGLAEEIHEYAKYSNPVVVRRKLWYRIKMFLWKLMYIFGF